MTDRELLELAAKAAGIEYDEDSELWDGNCRFDWNPLDDDGDALRLAVNLGFLGSPLLQLDWIEARRDTDPYAATRRAIVRAAAAIGEKL